MKGSNAAGGYTIVEVMMFLAISGLLFVIAIFSISGQQRKTTFTQGARDFQASVDDIMNDVRNGNYPTSGSFKCGVNGSGDVDFTIGSASPQGTHGDCMFIGKVVQFNSSNTTMNVYTVAGRRLAPAGSQASSFSDARPTIVPGIGYSESFSIPNGLKVSKVISKTNGGLDANLGAIGFMASFTSTNAQGLAQNNNTTVVVPIRGSDMSGGAIGTYVSNLKINGAIDANPPATAICFGEGANGLKALLIIGSKGEQTTTELHYDDAASALTAIYPGESC